MYQLLNGNAYTELQKLEAASIDMMITSPPYYGLRNYETEPVVWGGKKNCEHVWGETSIKLHYGKSSFQPPKNLYNMRKGQEDLKDHQEIKSHFCQLCNAWRGELGSEPSVELYIKHLGDIFSEVYRVLKDPGTCWINIADTYNGSGGRGSWQANQPHYKISKQKELSSKCQLAVPERLVVEMLSRGWIKRNTIVWHKPSCLPSSAKDRFTVDFEYLYFFTKQSKYYFEQQFEPYAKSTFSRAKYSRNHNKAKDTDYNQGIWEKVYQPDSDEGRNMRSVWQINPNKCKEAHFATFPPKLITTPIIAGCPKGGTVLDPFTGSGVTGEVSLKLGRNFVGIEISSEYMEMAERKLEKPDLFKI